MIIEPIDNRLYKISNVLPDDYVKQILEIDWDQFPKSVDERMPLRRSINVHGHHRLITDAEDIIHSYEAQIEEVCNIKFDRAECINTSWWYDMTKFAVQIHTDGHLPCTLQLFWHAPGEQYGTKFYNTKREHDLKYDFPFIPNTGYLMLNGLDADGSQPLQWHGMLNRVPPGTYRLTSYTRFGTYTDK